MGQKSATNFTEAGSCPGLDWVGEAGALAVDEMIEIRRAVRARQILAAQSHEGTGSSGIRGEGSVP